MSLASAQAYSYPLPDLPEGPPYICADLNRWIGCSFWLDPTDSRLLSIHNGESPTSPALHNLEGMIHYWTEHPEWMDMLNPDSPVYVDKQLERELYVHHWEPYISSNMRILEFGAGVGRITQWLLNQECEVQVIEPDLRSIWRLLSHIAGGKGSIDIHWSTGESMPELGLFDAVVACEVLNYVEDVTQCIKNIHQALRPGGWFLFSVEARWGWAMSSDVAEGSIDAFFDTGIVHVPHDRWIRTYTEEQIRRELQDFDIILLQPSHYSLSGPFEMIVGQQNIEDILSIEQQLRQHPIAQHLNRAWMVVAQKRSH